MENELFSKFATVGDAESVGILEAPGGKGK